MMNPMKKGILAAGTVALAVAVTRVASAPRAAEAPAAPSPDRASTALLPSDDATAGARASRSGLAGLGATPRDDGSDTGDDDDDGGDDDGGGEG